MTSLKRNHHYVPRFWQKYFADPTGKLYAREKGQMAKAASPRALMSGDWIYTVFDNKWVASDTVEDLLSQDESEAAAACRALLASAAAPDPATHAALMKFIALQACRHPDVLGRTHRRSKELGAVIARVHSMSESVFVNAIEPFGVEATDARSMFAVLKTRSQTELDSELQELMALSPYDPQLPQTDALLAQPLVESQLAKMNLIVLDAAPTLEFVLGDTPVPQDNLRSGFIVPITKAIALMFQPTLAAPLATRRVASSAEVDACNRWQFDNSLKVTIGSNSVVLNAL
jgi:Protein of unknown function (DUF4238)